MQKLHQPKLETDPNEEDLEIIRRGIDENNVLVTGQSTGNRQIVFFVRDSNGMIIGGVGGFYNSSGWLYVSGLWVAKEQRAKGYGSLLMQSIEAEAKRNGCTKSHLYTIEHQAPEFYKKLGYVVFARLEKFHQQFDKIFFRKYL
jgi:GNAT superfamily N-acetyltransferase